MSPTLTTADFVAALAFSNKIEDAQLRPYIEDAAQLDLLPLLGHETLERLARLVLPTAQPYAGPSSLPLLLAGTVVSRWDRLYRTLTDAPTTEPPVLDKFAYVLPSYTGTYPADPAPEADGNWQFLRLETLWLEYLKPYWLRAAYVRFLQNHGVNVTKAGLTVPIDRAQGTYDRPSGAQVASVLHEAQGNADTRRARLTRFLRFAGLSYYYDGETGHGGYWLDSYGCGYGSDWESQQANPARQALSRPHHTQSKGRFRAR